MSRQQSRGAKKHGIQREKEKAKVQTEMAVVVTPLDPHMQASEALRIFENTKGVSIAQSVLPEALGVHVETKKHRFVFLGNTTGGSSLMRMRMSLADINLVLVGKEVAEETEVLLKQARQSNLVFLMCSDAQPAYVKKYVAKTFGKYKVYNMQEIDRVLDAKVFLNRKRQTRPGMIATSAERVSENVIRLTGSVDKGFVSHNVLINGSTRAAITEILVDGMPLDLAKLKTLTREDLRRDRLQKEEKEDAELASLIEGVNITERFVPTPKLDSAPSTLGWISTKEIENSEESEEWGSRDADSESNESCTLSEEDSEQNSEADSFSSSTAEEEAPQEFAQYKGFRSINLGIRNSADSSQLKRFREQNLPEYYAQLNFVQNDHIRKRLLAKRSPVPTQTPLVITLEVEAGGLERIEAPEGFISLQGLFDYEGLPTICTLSFSASTSLSPYTTTGLVMDHGFCFSSPAEFAVGAGTDIVKCKRESSAGTLCYIGPLVLTDDKVLLVKDNKIVGTGAQTLRKDPIILATVTFKGRPIKINKRMCIIGKMFKTRQEVKHFRDIRLYSSERKEGRIKKPLGEHGLMKCYFCPPIKHYEKVYMELARRVFLKAPEWMAPQ